VCEHTWTVRLARAAAAAAGILQIRVVVPAAQQQHRVLLCVKSTRGQSGWRALLLLLLPASCRSGWSFVQHMLWHGATYN
jgi:hypothetical protein